MPRCLVRPLLQHASALRQCCTVAGSVYVLPMHVLTMFTAWPPSAVALFAKRAVIVALIAASALPIAAKRVSMDKMW